MQVFFLAERKSKKEIKKTYPNMQLPLYGRPSL